MTATTTRGEARTLAERVRAIAREYQLMAYSSVGDDPRAARNHATRAATLHEAADALDRASFRVSFTANPGRFGRYRGTQKRPRPVRDEGALDHIADAGKPISAS